MSLKRKIGYRILAAALSLTLVFSLPFILPGESHAASRLTDIRGHWAEGYITRAYNKDYVNGYPDGRFLPDRSVTRAEFVSMVNNAFDIRIDADAVNFMDVTYDKWYYKAISTAVTAAYTSGFGDNTFQPDSPITRQEAAVMLSNILPNYKGGGNLKSYRDYRLIASWATAALEKMTGRKYFGPYSDGLLHPADQLTRAQAAKILCDVLDNETVVTRRTTVDEDKTTLSEKIYADDVYIDEDLGEGSATIDNCVILGALVVQGGGSGTITINNSRVSKVIVDKDDTAVRIVTKGSTVIPKLSASRKSILQTAGKDGTGILDVTVNRGADVTMKGNFPLVTIAGSTATVALESGKITNLTVTGAGKYSDITLTGKAQIAEATVNAECYFHGQGEITQMWVNANNVTYETKPKKMTVATTIDRAVEEGDEDVDTEFRPRHRATGVPVDTQITITFTSSMKLADGKAISPSNIKEFISLREDSRSGDDVEFKGEINSAKKVITLTPTAELATDTTYYVILEDEALVNAGGTKNDGNYIYFTTSSKGGSTSASFSPSNGQTGVSPNTSIRITLKEDVVKYSDGGAVTSAYLQECVQLKVGSSGGSSVPFTASISSSDTITVTPGTALTAGQSYYVGIVANKLKTKSGGKAIPAASVIWTVAPSTPVTTPSAAVLSSLKVTPHGGSNALTGFSASTSAYDVTVPFGTSAVDVEATAASGTAIQINGNAATSAAISLNPAQVTPVKISAAASGLTTTNYTVNVSVAGNTSLNGISIGGIVLVPGADTFAANVAAGATSVDISVTTADPNAKITIAGVTGTGSCSAAVSLSADSQTVSFTVTSNLTTKTYTVYISRFAP